MASADFCILTIPISQRGAISPRFLSAFFVSYLTNRAGHSLSVPGYLLTGDPTGNFTGNDSTLHGIQISPDKDVNFWYANASFTVSPAPWA